MMDPFLTKIIEVGVAERMGTWQSDTNLAAARQRDTALHGLKIAEGVIAKELLVSDDVSEASRINMAARIPTTLDQPSAVVGK